MSTDSASPAALRRALWVLAAIIVVFGAVGADLLVQADQAHAAGSALPGGTRTQGSVVAVSKSCTRGCTYIPTISFSAGGQTYLFEGVVRDSSPKVGSSDAVSYDPADPAVAHDLGGGSSRSILDLVLGLMALGLATVGAWVYVRGLLRLRRGGTTVAATGGDGGSSSEAWDPTWDESLRDQPRDEDRRS